MKILGNHPRTRDQEMAHIDFVGHSCTLRVWEDAPRNALISGCSCGEQMGWIAAAILGRNHTPQPDQIPHEDLGARKLTGPPPPPAKRPGNTIRRTRN